MNVLLLYVLLLQATVTSFSGLTSLPVVHDELVVRRGVLTDEQLNAALAIGQTTPGPVGLYLVTVGYLVAGVPGAVAGVLALATPALLAIPLLGALKVGRTESVAGAARGIVIAASVLTLGTTFGLAESAVPDVTRAGIAVIALAVTAATQISPIWIVVVAGIAGLVVL